MKYKHIDIAINYKRIGDDQLYCDHYASLDTIILQAILEFLVHCDKLNSLAIDNITISTNGRRTLNLTDY